MKKHIINDWIRKNPYDDKISLLFEEPVTDELPAPQSAPSQPVIQNPNFDMGVQNPAPVAMEPPPQEEVPQEKPQEEIDFEIEKIDYLDMSLKQKNDEMMDKLLEMRNIQSLSPGQYKFITDNIQVLSLARDVDFNDARKSIYKRIKETFGDIAEPVQDEEIPDTQTQDVADQETAMPQTSQPEEVPTPYQGTESVDYIHKNLHEVNEELGSISGVEIYSIISEEIERYNTIIETLIKLPSFYAMKADLFRKIICAVSNGTQIGSGGSLEDVFIPLAEGGVGIKLCTRIYTDFGNIEIGKWSPKINDPETFLSDEELERLNNSGSPEEKEILKKRVMIESISTAFADKIYLMLICKPESGERIEVGFNLSELVKTGWQNGTITIDFKANIGKGQATLDLEGNLIELQNIVVSYIKDNNDKLDSNGKPLKEHIELLKLKNGVLYIVSNEEEFFDFTSINSEGIFYNKKQSDLDIEKIQTIQNCVPDIKEILLKKC